MEGLPNNQRNLEGEIAPFPKQIRLRPSVPPDNVALALRLKIPRRNKNNIPFANPHSTLDFASYSAEAFMSILTLNHNSVKAQHLNSHTKNVGCSRQNQVLHINFAYNLLLTQTATPLATSTTKHNL
jgi:hypothetical protein